MNIIEIIIYKPFKHIVIIEHRLSPNHQSSDKSFFDFKHGIIPSSLQRERCSSNCRGRNWTERSGTRARKGYSQEVLARWVELCTNTQLEHARIDHWKQQVDKPCKHKTFETPLRPQSHALESFIMCSHPLLAHNGSFYMCSSASWSKRQVFDIVLKSALSFSGHSRSNLH